MLNSLHNEEAIRTKKPLGLIGTEFVDFQFGILLQFVSILRFAVPS